MRCDVGLCRFAYNLNHPGLWISLNLKKPKKKAGGGRRKAKAAVTYPVKGESDDEKVDGQDEGSEGEQEEKEEQEEKVRLLSRLSIHRRESS